MLESEFLPALKRSLSFLGGALSVRQVFVLSEIGETRKEARTVRDLAEHLGIPKPSITRAIDKLVNHNPTLAVRMEDSADRRSVLVYRTAAGNAMLKGMAKAACKEPPAPKPSAAERKSASEQIAA